MIPFLFPFSVGGGGGGGDCCFPLVALDKMSSSLFSSVAVPSLSSLLPCCLCAVGVLSLCSVFPGLWFLSLHSSVLVRICGSLPSLGVFFITASTSGLSVLLGLCPCSFLLIHLCCLVRISVPSRRGRPLGRVSCFG